MTRMELKSKAKEILNTKLWDYWKPMLIVFLLSMLLGTGSGLLAKANPSSAIYFPSIISAVIMAPLSVGVCNYCLKMVRGEDYDINGIFVWYGKILPILGLTIMVGIITFCGFVLFVIPGIIASFALSQCLLVFADGETSIMACLRKSNEMMKGHKFDYFVLQLSFILWALLGAVTFGIAYIYVIPYMYITNILFYESIKN